MMATTFLVPLTDSQVFGDDADECLPVVGICFQYRQAIGTDPALIHREHLPHWILSEEQIDAVMELGTF